MKSIFQVFAVIAIAAGAYFFTASQQNVIDGEQVSVELSVEMMSVAEASSPGGFSCNAFKAAGTNYRACTDKVGNQCCASKGAAAGCTVNSYEPGKSCFRVAQSACGCYN